MKPHGFPSGRGARGSLDFSLKSQIPGLKIREFMVYVPGGSDKSAIMNKEREIRGRFAPSPTGPLHLGNAMTFLVAWLSVRSRGGRIVMRIEDIEGHGRDPAVIEGNCRDLLRLGLEWDEGYRAGGPHGPYRQSERAELYRRALDRLLEQELVYPCVCSRRDARQAGAAPHAGDCRMYDGRCRGRFADYAEAARALAGSGRLPAWRFRVPDREVVFRDRLCGGQRVNPALTYGDFPIARHPDGIGYQLAVVTDDIDMRITEVVRGGDLLECTPWQILLYRALAPEFPLPEFCHLPVVTGADGKRLAKRTGSLTLESLFERGVRPGTVLGLLAFWGGWAEFGEELTLPELLDRFDLSALRGRKPCLDGAALRLLGAE